MPGYVKQARDWRLATAHLDLRHVPTGVLFRLTPKVVVDLGGAASPLMIVHPANLSCVSRVPPLDILEVLSDEARIMGRLLYDFPN